MSVKNQISMKFFS